MFSYVSVEVKVDGKLLEFSKWTDLTEEQLDAISHAACAVHQRCTEMHAILPPEKRKMDKRVFGGNTRQVFTAPTDFMVYDDGNPRADPVFMDARARYVLIRHNRTKKPIGYEEAWKRSTNPWCLDYWLARFACKEVPNGRNQLG